MQHSYRKDIDGLRAVAIITVVLFHVEPNWFKGGFLGVDIFFVISGFLITKILLSDMAKGHFSLIKFYERRIVRIFPALILVILSCIFIGWFVQTANEFEKLGKHVIANAVFVSNFLLWTESGYFDTASETKPLLHLWSLAVEEQFYVVWPAIILIIWKFKLSTTLFISIFTITSLILTYSVAGGNDLSNGAFYLPVTRAWELCMGALLAHFYINESIYLKNLATKINYFLKKIFFHDDTIEINVLNNFISLIGLFFIFSSFYRVSNGEVFSLFITLPTVIGSCCLILCGPISFFNRYFLSNQILVFIGLISYPLYLWHWPLLSLSKYLNLPSIVDFFLILVACVLSWLTYMFIESPLRRKNNKRKSAILLIAGMIVTATLGLMIYLEKGFESRYQYQGEYKLNGSLKVRKPIDIRKCVAAPGVVDSWCNTTKKPETVLIGDSHIELLIDRFVENGNESFSKILFHGAGNCPLLMRSDLDERCTKQIMYTLKNLKLYPNLKYAIISSWNNQYGNPEKAIKAFKPVIESLRDKGIKIAMIVDNPTLKKNPRDCNLGFPKMKLLITKMPEYCTSPSISDFRPYENYAKFIDKVQKNYPDVFVFNPLYIFCKDSICKIRSGRIMNYIDEGHVTPFIGKKIVDAFVDNAKLNGFLEKK